MTKACHKYPKGLSARANALRKNATPGERKLWFLMQHMRLSSGIRFRRQQPFGPYIVDFYCAAYKCVIEIDGASHEAKKAHDAARDAYMTRLGIRTLRFTEQETSRDPSSVLQTILQDFGLETPPPTPPSRGGE